MWLLVAPVFLMAVPPAWQPRENAVDPADENTATSSTGNTTATDAAPSYSYRWALQPAPADFRQQAYRNTSTWSWGGSIIHVQGDPHGRPFHMFAEAQVGGCGVSAWQSNGKIIHATSATPTGPYRWVDDALPVWHTGPHIMRATDGTFLLWSMGTTNASRERVCKNGSPIGPTPPDPLGHGVFRSRLHAATSVYGPWTEVRKCASQSIQCDLLHAAVNPNPVAQTTPNGTIIVMGAGTGVAGESIDNSFGDFGIATAPHWRGPYTARPGYVLLPPMRPPAGTRCMCCQRTPPDPSCCELEKCSSWSTRCGLDPRNKVASKTCHLEDVFFAFNSSNQRWFWLAHQKLNGPGDAHSRSKPQCEWFPGVGGFAQSKSSDFFGDWEYDFWAPAYGLNAQLTNGSEYCLTSREWPKLFSYQGRDFLTNSGCPSDVGPGDTGCFTWLQELKKPGTLNTGGPVASSPSSHNVSVTVSSRVVHTVSEKFLSFAIDTCGVVGTCGEVDWQGSKLRYLASQLAPANLRLGGSGASCVTYIVPGRTAHVPSWNTTGPCKWGQHNLTMATWAQALDFVEAAGLQFTFDLNELAGRTCHDQDDPTIKHNASYCLGEWDTSNTREFLQFITRKNLTAGLVALELGNELTRMQPHWKGILTINQTIQDFHALSAAIDEVWAGTQLPRPMLMGPASSVCVEQDVVRFLRETAGVLGSYSFHSYEDGSGANMWADIANASWLREHGPLGTSKWTNGNTSACTAAVQTAAAEGITPEVWLTETNSAYKNQPNGSNAFLNLYWYATSLGQYAAAGLTIHNYFTLTQGRLAMLGCGLDVGMCAEDKLRPNPTYFLAVLHKRLVGTRVLAVSTSDESGSPLVFAHCARARAGGVVLMVVNPAQSKVMLSVGLGPFEQYSLTAPAGNVNSSSLQLNGRVLVLAPSTHKLPPMDPAIHDSTGAVLVPAKSVGFAVFPKANLKACSLMASDTTGHGPD